MTRDSLTNKIKNVLWDIMRIEKAKEITGSLSKPSKMPGHAYGLPAKECKTGGKLQKVKGSTCYGCYALKGCYVFKVVQDAQAYEAARIDESIGEADKFKSILAFKSPIKLLPLLAKFDLNLKFLTL